MRIRSSPQILRHSLRSQDRFSLIFCACFASRQERERMVNGRETDTCTATNARSPDGFSGVRCKCKRMGDGRMRSRHIRLHRTCGGCRCPFSPLTRVLPSALNILTKQTALYRRMSGRNRVYTIGGVISLSLNQGEIDEYLCIKWCDLGILYKSNFRRYSHRCALGKFDRYSKCAYSPSFKP